MFSANEENSSFNSSWFFDVISLGNSVFYCKIMPSLSVWNHENTNLFFTIDIVLQNVFKIHYPVQKIYRWSKAIQIYFMAFAVKQVSISKDKINIFNWCFQANLASLKKQCKNFFAKISYHKSWLLCYHFLNALDVPHQCLSKK